MSIAKKISLSMAAVLAIAVLSAPSFADGLNYTQIEYSSDVSSSGGGDSSQPDLWAALVSILGTIF
jgi:hypothetical protein